MRDSSDDDQGEIWSVSTWSFEACHGGKRLLPKMLLCVIMIIVRAPQENNYLHSKYTRGHLVIGDYS